MSYMDKMDQYGFVPANHATPAYFPVQKIDLFDGDGHKVHGHIGVRRQDTMQILGVHTDAYQMVTHEDVHEAFMGALRTTSLDLTDMRVGKDTSHDGARMFLQLVLPGVQVDMGGGDLTAMRIVCFNSYDGSTSVKFRVGGYRFVCANTAVIGKDIAAAAKRHVSGFDLDALARGLVDAASAYLEETKRWQLWAQTPVSLPQAMSVFKAIPGSNDAMRGVLMERWIAEPQPTLWALYNVLTAWSTHTESKTKNAMAARMTREERVAKAIECKEWRVLEDA